MIEDNDIREQAVELMVKLSLTTEEADSCIEEFAGILSTKDKIDYLLKTFDAEIIHRTIGKNSTEEQILEDDYIALLTAIINSKWR